MDKSILKALYNRAKNRMMEIYQEQGCDKAKTIHAMDRDKKLQNIADLISRYEKQTT